MPDFLQKLCNPSLAILKKTYQHPFNIGMKYGYLPKEIFNFYIQQDIHYLKHYAVANQKISERLIDEKHKKLFQNITIKTIKFEQRLIHEFYNRPLTKLINPDNSNLILTKATIDYIEYLEKNSKKAIEYSLVSIMPCFIVYYYLGQKMLPQSLPNNYYHRWVKTYNHSQYIQNLDHIARLFTIMMENNPQMLDELSELFKEGCIHELRFFDEAYHAKITDKNINSINYKYLCHPKLGFQDPG